MKNHDDLPEKREEKKALARDVTRFKTLYPNGEAVLSDTPTTGFAYLNSAEMVALNS